MKKIIAFVFAIYSALSFSATLNPIQLLNPAGSTAGQAIVSTGASSAPAWGGVGVNGIAAIAANTVLANATGSSASPTAFAMPNCSSTTGVLTYTAGTGFQCSTVVNVTNGIFSGTITPSQTGGIVGTTTNNNANAGSVGEYVSGSTGLVSLTSSAVFNATSLSLAAGDWEVGCTISFVPASTTVTNSISAGISTTSVTFPGANSGGLNSIAATFAGSGAVQILSSPTVRESLASTTTVYCVGSSAFTTSTSQGEGFMWARRRR